MGGENSKTRTNQIIHTVMIVVVITMGMVIGWIVGNYLLDRYINEGNEDINKIHDKK
jgi:hypothetical protein